MTEILIVDDETPIAALLNKMLAVEGFRCELAADAAQARKLLADRAFDLLISDIHMPGESGLDLARFVKTQYPQTAIVIISVIDDPQTAKTLIKAGIHGYIVKPFDMQQALITVHNALTRRDLEIEAHALKNHLEDTVRQRTAALEQTLSDLEHEKAKTAAATRQVQDQLLFMQSLRDAIPSPIYFKDGSGRYQGCNKAFEQFLGRSRNDIIGKTIHEIAPIDRALIHAKVDEEMLQGQETQVYEAPVRFADGSMRDVLINKSVVRNSAGHIDGLVGVMTDITGRKNAEQSLRQSEEKLRQVINNIGIGVAVIGPRMQILEMNRKMREWFPGVDLALQPVCFAALHHPAKPGPCDICPALRTLSSGKVQEAIETIQTPQGIRTFRMVTTPIHDTDGAVAAIVKMMDDITEKLNMERELLQNQKMASIGQLAAGVAHEINNPTGFVSSNLNTLEDYRKELDRLFCSYSMLKQSLSTDSGCAVTPDIRAMVAEIEDIEAQIDVEYIRQDLAALIGDCRSGTERIKKIVEDLKHFAHPGQDKVQDTDLNKELETTLSVVHNELKYKATVVKEFGELPIIKANPQQLNQVFINILVNAAQAIEKMGDIIVKTFFNDGYAQVEISDTGCGIAPEHLNKIFDPFFTTKEVGKGTGLGMNIAYNIIKKHNGSIDVQSKIGRGTTFTIKLPIDLSDAAE
ncbi:MAG: PAS domain S-box protein [Desulfobacteraceae bacterium]|nr:PAS domain S-box protein [Desulfobacteraceae bacterium]